MATNSWLKHLWEFCHETNLQIEATTPQLQLARTDDEFLMPKFAAYGYRNDDLSKLNLCRLFCHATRLSDITTGDGLRIHPLSWNGYPTSSSGIEYDWPTHASPTAKVWELWRTALYHCFLNPETSQQTLL